MQHDGIAYIDTAMAHAGGIVGSLEKYKVARFDLRRRNRSTEVVKALCGARDIIGSTKKTYDN